MVSRLFEAASATVCCARGAIPDLTPNGYIESYLVIIFGFAISEDILAAGGRLAIVSGQRGTRGLPWRRATTHVREKYTVRQ